MKFDDWHRGGWDPVARLADQDRDGVAAEIIYPTVGMMLCNHPDFDYKHACFDAYNRWIAEYCASQPNACSAAARRRCARPPRASRTSRSIKALGLRGVMMPGDPALEDYDSPIYDPFWETAVDLGLPLSFHILTTPQAPASTAARVINSFCRSSAAIRTFSAR